MKKTSRKNLRPKAQKRTDHPAGCRISTEERTRIQSEIIELKDKSGIDVTIGSYTKHALLNHSRLRRIEQSLKHFVSSEDIALYFEAKETSDLVKHLQSILVGAR